MYIHIRAHHRKVCALLYISAWASVLLVQVKGNSRALRCGTATVQSRFFVYIPQTMRIRDIFHKEHFNEFLRFCFVGVLATGIHYGIYLLLIKTSSLEGQIWINAAYLIGFIISWLCNLWMTARITFKTHLSLKRGVGFAVTHGVNYLLHLLFLNIFLAFGITEQMAPIPVYCCVVPINFILVRIVFKSNKIQ